MVLKTPFMGFSGGVSSEHPLASIVGCQVLDKGGNAVDAAVSVSLTLAVTQPHLGSIGGDFFALIFEASSGEIHCLNSSGWTPKGLNLQLLEERGLKHIPVNSPHAVVVPGLVSGLQMIHERFGTMSFRELAEKAVSLAEEGFPVTHGLSRAIERGREKLIGQTEASIFFRDHGEPLRPGDIIYQRALAKTLRSIASNPREFYEGWIAESLCRFLNSMGGVFDIDDFSEYEGEWVSPLKTNYRGFDVYEVPPNSQGATTLILLNILENFDLQKLDPLGARRIHIFVEAAKRAYMEKNRHLGDPRFVDIPLEELLSKEKGRKLAETIREEGIIIDASLSPGDTTNFIVIDRWGNVVSAIQSIFHHFGSGLIDPETGILLNSRASYFTFSGPNRLEPRKRPLHTLSAVIAASEEGEILALGTSGGDYRPQQHALLLTNLIDYGLDLQRAVELPRFLWMGGADILVEEGYKGLEELTRIGHKISLGEYPGRTGVAHCGIRRQRLNILSADVRGDGIPIGPLSR